MLTKDEIDAAWNGALKAGGANRETIAAAVIAAHTAKVLGDVEPVAYLYFSMSGRGERAMESLSFNPRDPACFGMTREDLCRAHTVAALKSERDALAARVAELEKDALPEGVSITGYTIDMSNPMDYIRVERARQIQGPPLWAVRNARQDCLNKSGEWEWEPLPSSRDDEFLARCRFPSARAAIDAATLAAKGQA